MLYNIAAVMGAVFVWISVGACWPPLCRDVGAGTFAGCHSHMGIRPHGAIADNRCLFDSGRRAGAFGVIPANMNELSPASVRGLFPGFVYQLGVLVVSPATMIELEMCNIWGYSWALAAFAAAIIVILVFSYTSAPKDMGRTSPIRAWDRLEWWENKTPQGAVATGRRRIRRYQSGPE
jgi:hypothetical protein